MAGIGFELKKLFSSPGILPRIRASMYASMVVAGPVILGTLLLFGMKLLSGRAGATGHEQDIIMVVITYSLLFPLMLTSLISYVLTRYVADMLYENKDHRILPSMYGAISILLFIGAPAWALFLYLSKLPVLQSLFSFILFCAAVIVWIQVSYLNAVKDYKSIFLAFLVSITAGLSLGYWFIQLNYEMVASLLAAAAIAFGLMATIYTIVIHRYFPTGSGSAYKFVEWIDRFPTLVFTGLFSTIGLFLHLMLMWGSPWGEQVHGLFYHAPRHDIAALGAYFTTLISSVNLITTVEVRFYPIYRVYFSLLNESGSLGDINKARAEMIIVLSQELFYLALRQLFVTIVAVVVIGEVISNLGLGFTTATIGVFRVLCVGYALCAVGNSMMLMLLYFADNRGALLSASSLLAVNLAGTLYTITLPENYYGFGFLAAGIAFCLVGILVLGAYTSRLEYFIFAKNPGISATRDTILIRFIRWLDRESAEQGKAT
jgi:uncharacterized membrane protein